MIFLIFLDYQEIKAGFSVIIPNPSSFPTQLQTIKKAYLPVSPYMFYTECIIEHRLT